MLLAKHSSRKIKAHEHKRFGPVAHGTNPGCPRDKPRFSPYYTQWKPSLFLGQFVSGTNRWRMAAETVYVLKVYVPHLLPNSSL